jgi:hypothetical protein
MTNAIAAGRAHERHRFLASRAGLGSRFFGISGRISFFTSDSGICSKCVGRSLLFFGLSTSEAYAQLGDTGELFSPGDFVGGHLVTGPITDT